VKITRIEAVHVRLPQVLEVADGTQDCLLVRIHTDDGISGLGEAVSCSYVARAVIEAPRSAPFRHGLDAIANGMDPLDHAAVLRALESGTAWYGPEGVVRHAIGAVDMALWDIRGKVEGVPVRKLLDSGAEDSLPCYASVYCPDSVDEVAAAARQYREQGYRAVKFGWGPIGADARLDEELVAAAREALGPDALLMIDVGRVWDVDTALERVERLRPYDLHWLEEPLQPRDFAGYAKLTSCSSIAIAAGEALTAMADFERLISQGHIDVVQPDLGHAGGITGGQKIAALARQSGARALPHAFGTGVVLAASANWAAANSSPTEHTRSTSPLAQDLVQHAIRFENGLLQLSQDAGLGVELDEEVVSRYRLS
jgi:L-alanine-DL-glutamate epimerase-like enolase superfamily enzyme